MVKDVTDVAKFEVEVGGISERGWSGRGDPGGGAG